MTPLPLSTIRQSGSVLDAADPSFGSPSGIHRAQSPTTDTGGLVLTRRDLFTLLGSAAVLVACGGKSHTTSSISVSSGTPESVRRASATRRRRRTAAATRRPAVSF